MEEVTGGQGPGPPGRACPPLAAEQTWPASPLLLERQLATTEVMVPDHCEPRAHPETPSIPRPLRASLLSS